MIKALPEPDFRYFSNSKALYLSSVLFYDTTQCGDDARNFEPKVRLKFEDLDKSIQKLRAIYKVHPEWFEVPKPKSDKGKNEVDYSI